MAEQGSETQSVGDVGTRGGDGNGHRLVVVPKGQTPPRVTADLDALATPDNDASAKRYYANRDAGRCSIMAVMMGNEYAGVMVLAIGKLNEGQALNVWAVNAPGCGEYLQGRVKLIAAMQGCRIIYATTGRGGEAVTKFWAGAKQVEATFAVSM